MVFTAPTGSPAIGAHSYFIYHAGKDSPSRYEGYADLSLDEIADVYGLDLHEYLDMAAYSENSKKQILEAIKKDRKESA